MSYEKKNFCTNCKVDASQLAREYLLGLDEKEKKLKTCSYCKIAQYCDTQCQKEDFRNLHKRLCAKNYKRFSDLAPKLESALKARGHDVNRNSLEAFYKDNDAVFQRIMRVGQIQPSELTPLENGAFYDVGKMFSGYNLCKGMCVKMLGEIARRSQSYHGMEMAIDAYLEHIVRLQPHHLYMRALIPLMMIQVGKDDDAYNFIKFWLQNTPKNQDFVTNEEGLFPNLPFTEVTMQGQDKNEDILQVLGVGSEKPYFVYIAFYICLAIIKKKNFDATKNEKQKEHFIKYLKYIKRHFKNLVKKGLSNPPAPTDSIVIPTSFGLKADRSNSLDAVQIWAGNFLNNFMMDLNFYFERDGAMRQALLKYL